MQKDKFEVWVEGPTFEMSIDEIWPDKDGPDNPTADDVVDAMRNYGDTGLLLRDWSLNSDLKIYVEGIQV